MRKPIPVVVVRHKMWALRNEETGDMVRDALDGCGPAVALFHTREDARALKYGHETPIRVMVTVEEINPEAEDGGI